MKRVTLEPWTAFDKHCLTSAVSRVGDQNWTAVSRQTKNIYEECNKYLSFGEKKPEWFSNKQCAAQYEHLLKNVPPRRKKRAERTPDQGAPSESPAEILQQTSRHEFIEELKRTIAEEQALYLKLFKEYEEIKAGRLDHKLEEMQEEYDAKEREKEIKLKLKFKLGEKSMAETSSAEHEPVRPSSTAETPTTPTKTEKEVGPEPHKTTVTTSPLLTSLLQSPSPLTRPSSATPTISLLLNSSPSVPSNESPTLSRLLESSCPTPVSSAAQISGASSSTNQRLLSTPQSSRPQLAPSTPLSALVSDLPAPKSAHPAPLSGEPLTSDSLADEIVLNPDASAETSPELSKDSVAEIAALEEELMQTAESIVSETTKKVNSVALEVAGANEKPLEEKKRGLPRRLDLENLEAEEEESTESQVVETVEEIIEKVQTAIIETVGDGGGNETSAQDISNAAESETATTEDHSLDALELTSDAVQLIVVGPDHPPNYEVNMKDEESKGDATEDVPDIDEIQPSLSASDIAQIQEPLKDQVPTPQDENVAKEETVEDIRSPPVTIEQAEADLASITREEEGDDKEDVAETPQDDIPVKEAVVVVERVDEVKLEEIEAVEREEPAKEVTEEPEEPELDVKESQNEEVPEESKKETKNDDVVEEVTKEEDAENMQKSDVKEPVESKTEQEDVESVSEQTKAESEDEDDAQERDSIASRPVEVEDVTTGTENTSDSFVEKVMQEEDTKDRESEASEEEKKTEEPLPAPVVEQEVVEKPKPAEKPVAKKEEKFEVKLEEKVEEIRSGKRELRRGRATPPVTSPAVAFTERTLREKRPTTPSSSSDGREEPTPRSAKRKRTTNVSESSVPCSPSPSIVSNDDDKDYRAWKKSILLVYDRIAAHKYASVFLKPINENDAPSYFQMIKCPTDLTTIKRQIESGVIRNTVDFQKEMLLMISNAMIYNKSDTLVHKMACEMLPDMKEAMETMVQALGSGVPLDQPDSRPPVTARVSRASVSAKGQGEDSGVPTPSGPASAKRKRQQPPEDTRSKRKRSDAS